MLAGGGGRGWPAGLLLFGPSGELWPRPRSLSLPLPDGAFIGRLCSAPPGSCWLFCASHPPEAEKCPEELVLVPRQLSSIPVRERAVLRN